MIIDNQHILNLMNMYQTHNAALKNALIQHKWKVALREVQMTIQNMNAFIGQDGLLQVTKQAGESGLF